nr:glycosyltransferase family 4 protein [uncultured Methanoregula sp.]
MNICLALPYHPSTPYGGPESVASNTIQGFKLIHKRLETNDVHLTILSNKGNNIKLTSVIDPEYSNIKLNFYKNYCPVSITGDFQAMIRQLQLKKTDIIHSHILQNAVASVLLKKTTFLTVHGMFWKERNFVSNNFDNVAYSISVMRIKWLKDRINRIIAISPYVIDEFNSIGGISQDRSIIIENPISESFFQIKRTEKKDNIIICPGSITRRKNQEALIKAVDLVNKRGFDCKVIFTGSIVDIEYCNYLKKLIDKFQLNENVFILGSISHDRLLEIYANASLLCLTSLQETTPMAIAEAMACGIPVIASDVGGVKYMITHAEDGMIIKPNDIELIALTISNVLGSQKLMDKFTQNGKSKANNRWKSDIISNRLLDLYLQYK